LRRRSANARTRAENLIQHSTRLLQAQLAARDTGATRGCPACGGALSWIEKGRIGGVEYDYYRWCQHGCGLYCYDCAGAKWVKLA
jgi:hypothetical protein